MRLRELITEDPVASSWITDITPVQRTNDLVMALANGRRYRISGAARLFTAWKNSASKGEFWHQQVRNRYAVKRLI